MELMLKKKVRNPVIIEGFPGFGLVGTIVTEFLIEHLKAELIGKIHVPEVPPVIAIHAGKVVEPVGIFYVKKNNLIILHALTSVQGLEWKLADQIEKLYKQTGAKMVVSIEGVGSPGAAGVSKPNAFCITNVGKCFDKEIKPLNEGIIMGVTGALLLKKGMKRNSLFVETQSNLPDSKAAARAIDVLNKYLKLKVDTKPLVKKAQHFETKIKTIFDKSKTASKQKQRKEMSYFG